MLAQKDVPTSLRFEGQKDDPRSLHGISFQYRLKINIMNITENTSNE